MQPSDLLGATFACECGRTHTVPLRRIAYSATAVADLPRWLRADLDVARVALVADTRTYRAAGRDVEQALRADGLRVSRRILPDPPSGDPVCDDITRSRLAARLSRPCDLLVAVGAGVVNDLCKWIAAETHTPYIAVATAASMNGYASANIAPAIQGVKRVIDGTVPVAIVADPGVLAAAPCRLTAAGLGDVLAKPVSMTDWRVNHLLFDEYFCPLCAGLIRDLEPAYRQHPERVKAQDPAAIEALFMALVYSGLAMTLAGTSFPASGGEHLISHVLDMTALRDGTPHDYHGRQVGLGTIVASALYERLLAVETPDFRIRANKTDPRYWGRLTPVVEEEHARKRARAARARGRLREGNTWDRVRALIRESAAGPAEIKRCLRTAGAAHCLDDIGCARERFAEAVRHSHEIRERYTVIDLARAAGILPDALDEILDEYLVE